MLAILAAAAVPMDPTRAQNAQPAEAVAEVAIPPQRAQPRNPGALMDRAAESGAQVYVDDSFASVDKLRTAIRYSEQGQSQLAINEFQSIITNYGQKLVYLDDNSYVSITDYVREKLLQLPAVKQGMYDQIFGGEAQKAVDAALATRDAAALIRVCDRFFPSAAAFAGLQRAAEWYFERGEFSPASRTWQALLQHPLAGKSTPELLFRAALAETLARNAPAAKVLRERLEKEAPDATGSLFGEDVKLLPKLDELGASPAWDAAGVDLAKDDYPAFGGGPGRSKLLDVNAAIGARLGAAPTERSTETAAGAESVRARANIQALRARGQAEPDGPLLSSFSVLSGGTLFVHTGERLMALSANAGSPLWSYPSQPVARPASSEAAIRYGAVVARAAAHDAPAVFGDGVFAVMPGFAEGGGFVDPRLGTASAGGAAYSRVVCINRDDGTERWSCAANEVKLEAQAVPAEGEGNDRAARLARAARGMFSFVGSPLVTRQGVFVMARRVTDSSFAQQYLVRLDRESGEVTWTCYICSTSSGAMYGNPYYSLSSIPVPTLVDDVLYISTEQGADCAVDANIGRILWLRVVDTGEGKRAVGDYYTNTSVAVAAWKFNPPVVAGNTLLVADNANLRVYDRWSGKVLNTLKAPDLGPTRFDVIAGPVNGCVVVTGERRIFCLALDDLLKAADKITPVWQMETPTEAGKPQGRPFLSTTAFYVPYEHKLVHIDLKSGTREAWDWPNTEKDLPGKPGNLLVTPEQVVVVTDNEIAGYSKWETARDNRLARISKNPSEPRAYLDLAEISFRTNHHDLAQENMKKSVELANAQGNGTAAAAAAEVLARLYRTNLNFAEQLLGKNDNELRDRSRFYFEQCRAAAREPEQQAEWRLRLAELSLKQKRREEAATLYNEVLVDPSLRVANYREGDVLASAGATAEQRMRKLISDANAGAATAGGGAELYRRFEDQAAALLEKARSGRDLAGLQQVMEGYPNARSAITAATELASAHMQKQDWQNARKVLWWLIPRTQAGIGGAARSEAHQRAIADLVRVSLGLKKYASAAAWAARGASQFKDASFTASTGESLTFPALRKQVADAAASAGGGIAQAEGRLPRWYGDAITEPPMDTTPLDDANVLPGNLLAPVETSLAYRQPNLLFLQKGNTLRVYDTVQGKNAFTVALPKRDDCVLLGVSGKTAVLLSADTAIGINLETQRVWTQTIRSSAPVMGPGAVATTEVAGQISINGNGQVNIGGQIFVAGPDGTVIDAEGNPVSRRLLQGGADAELLRRAAFLTLQNPRFSTARLLNNTLLLVSGNQLTAINVADGEPAWRDRDRPVTVRLPAGRPVAVAGNEDVIVVQVDAADNSSSTFFTIDADTGQARRTIKIANDRALWRALGDDGSLFVVSENAVASYDLIGSAGTSEPAAPLWRRTDIQSRFATATALTLDGLVLVDNSLNVWCLSLESGEMRWSAPPRLSLKASLGAVTTLRSVVDGENVIFQSGQSSVAFRSMPAKDQLAWEGWYRPDVTPPLQSIQLTDPYVVELAMGAVSNNQNAVQIIFHDRRGGKLAHTQELNSARPGARGGAAAAADRTGPALRAWQVLDQGIALQVGDETHFWRNKPASATTAPAALAP
jgi:outer membrane protein assembly factor BamB